MFSTCIKACYIYNNLNNSVSNYCKVMKLKILCDHDRDLNAFGVLGAIYRYLEYNVSHLHLKILIGFLKQFVLEQ